jgi:hypothetical protein
MWLLLLVVFLSGCTVVIRDREPISQRERGSATGPLRAYCPSKIETVGFTARATGRTATLFKRAVGLGFIAKAREKA